MSTFGRNFEQTSDALGQFFALQELVGRSLCDASRPCLDMRTWAR